jgi:hypothetical protein
LTGLQGFTGVQGLTGSQGTTGTQGATGTQGLVGAQGLTGTQGVQGTQGVIGIQGPYGVPEVTLNSVSVSGTGSFKLPGAYYYTSSTGGTQSTAWVISLQGTTPPSVRPDGSSFGTGDIWISWA